MTVKLHTLRNDKGFMLRMAFLIKHTFKGELHGQVEIFVARWGFCLHFGPKYLIGD